MECEEDMVPPSGTSQPSGGTDVQPSHHTYVEGVTHSAGGGRAAWEGTLKDDRETLL